MSTLTITDLAADIWTAADVVGRENTGYIAGANQNAETTRASTGDSVKAAFTPELSSNAISESMTIPNGDAYTISQKTMQITNAEAVQIPMTGENARQLSNGAGYDTVYGDLISQAMRTLTNKMELALYNEAKGNAYLAFGATNASAFANDFDNVADARAALLNEGCPMDDVSLVLTNTAGAAARKSDVVNQANVAGSDSMVRNGILLPFYGVNVRETAQASATTNGSNADRAGTVDGNEAAGQTVLTVADCTAASNSGEVITIAGDSNQYILSNATQTTTQLTLSGGGLKAQGDNDAVITAAGAASAVFSHNLMFHRRALELAMRAPALPEGGDQAEDSITIQDQTSGLVFEVRIYRGYRKAMIEVGAAWGVKAWKPEFIMSVLHNA